MKNLLLSFFLLVSAAAAAQDGCPLRISLLTCAPGAELYSTFGHTAVRVQNAATGSDEVYNYGTFEFSDDFYVQFVRGKLLYALSVSSFTDFMYQYQVESRSVVEQDLALTCAQKDRLQARLRDNLRPEARRYRYDFLFDNCTTRARDMLDSGAGVPVAWGNILAPAPLTFRDHITVYLRRAHQDWSKLGIDLLLGAKMDRPATDREALFLPDNLQAALDKATAGGRPFVASKRSVLDLPSPATASYLLTPVVAFGLLLLATAALSFTKKPWVRRALRAFDFVLFFSTGLVGLLILFMWFGTDHALCANNYNLLWAVPANVGAAFFVHNRQGRWKGYFKIVFWLTVALLAAWAFLPQDLNEGFLPLVGVLAVRSWALSNRKTDGNKRVVL